MIRYDFEKRKGQPLYEYLYDLDANAQLRTITEFIYSIRKKFKILGLDPIKTIWGIGYKWDIK